MSERLRKEILAELDDAWLNINKDTPLLDPISVLQTDEVSDFQKRFAWLCSNPDYFSFFCKYILNIELLPFQALILQELWRRKFPMFIGSRGLGKATILTENILTDKGWVKMGDISLNHKVYGRDGKLHDITGIYPQGKKQVCRVTLADGRFIDCCEDHLWLVRQDNYKETVVTTKEIAKKYLYSNKTYSYKYRIPNNEPIVRPEVSLAIHPYILGCLLGDGCLTTRTPKIASNDLFIVEQFRKLLPDFKIEQDLSNNNYTIVDQNKDLITQSSKLGNQYIKRGGNRLYTKLKELDLIKDCYSKFIPDIYKNASIEQRMELIRGLIDTDGSVNENGSIEFTNVNEKLIDDIIEVLRSLGISCRKKLDDRSHEKHRLPNSKSETYRKPYFRVFINTSLPIAKLPRKLERIKNKSTRSEKFTSIVKVEYLDKLEEMQCISVGSDDKTYITTDHVVTHNSFILGVHAAMRTILLPERKVIIAGSSFRQSKIIYDYIEKIWDNAPILRDMADAKDGPRASVDQCNFRFAGGFTRAIPIGDGCLNPYTQITCGDSINNITANKAFVWGNGKFRSIEYNIDNGIKPTKIVTTKKGYSYEGTHNHAMKVLRNGKIDWVRTDDMQIGDRILIDRSIRWHKGDFDCSLDQAYALGAMIGDGSWTNEYYLRFTTLDKEIIDRVNSSFNKKFTMSSDSVHWNLNSKEERGNWLNFWGMEKCYTIDKELPFNILSSNKDKMTACLQGLFDTDGHVFVDQTKGGTAISVNLTNTSKRLIEQVQYILLHYGIISTLRYRDRKKWNRVYELGIYGQDVKKFADQINFHLSKKRNKLNNAIEKRKRWVSVDDNVPIDTYDLISSFTKVRPKKYSDYQIIKRKSLQTNLLKQLLSYCDDPSWSSLINNDIFYDTVESIIDSECYTYDIHVPEGNEYCANGFFSHNSKIRGQRANDIIADEFQSQVIEIFETIIAGFGAVSASPVDNVKVQAKLKKFEELKAKYGEDKVRELLQEYEPEQESFGMPNQVVIAGTAYYDFNHFAKYWKRWKQIILSKGKKKDLAEVFSGEEIPDGFDWRDYSIIRIPITMAPKGFMEDAQIARAKATIHSGIYLMEYEAVFTKDSRGFFKRSLIESCVTGGENPVITSSGNEVKFDAMLKGHPNKEYVIGVDPASERDNFAIMVLELNEDHNRIVYGWTINRKLHTEQVKAGLVDQNNFYAHCASKIRDLMKKFNVVRISIDSQGGGITISEFLHDENFLKHGEVPLWPIIEEEKEKETDFNVGLHIIELCNFAKYDWLRNANHGLRNAFERKELLFPVFDPIAIEIANTEDSLYNRKIDTFEDAILEIQELKNELSLIEMTTTAHGRDRWDVPEVKIGVGKKEKMTKDRYSALLMAQAGASSYRNIKPDLVFTTGDVSSHVKNLEKVDYVGPAWFIEGIKGVYDSMY